jgi:hypothetical protein
VHSITPHFQTLAVAADRASTLFQVIDDAIAVSTSAILRENLDHVRFDLPQPGNKLALPILGSVRRNEAEDGAIERFRKGRLH